MCSCVDVNVNVAVLVAAIIILINSKEEFQHSVIIVTCWPYLIRMMNAIYLIVDLLLLSSWVVGVRQ